MRNIQELLDLLAKEHLLLLADQRTGCLAPSSFTANSKDAEPGTFFVCKGFTFKKEYLEMAKERGAILYMAEQITEWSFRRSW